LLNPLTASEPARAPSVALRPSEYTAALIQVLRGKAARLRGAKALEIGSGSGVVLAALGALGAAALCGVDIEDEAVDEGLSLLRDLGYAGIARIQRGDMWQPVAGQRFDLIVANLPHFPMPPAGVKGRLSTWSCGGADGRQLLNPFLDGLAQHLAPGGRAVITHNAFVSVEASRAMLQRQGLALRIAQTFLVSIPDLKLDLLTPGVLAAEDGRTIHRYGPHAFADMHIVEIGAVGDFI
jgi:release factor glutamine methyltransferase